ncbi:MAG: Adenylosuccinate synthetase [Dehalococcoidia bacterium]|nr:Adenylosuccinate synthetase [Chloroflexota bacterium]
MNNLISGKVIIDLQFGSTGKGLISGYLAESDQPDTVVTAWAPNAGHTYIDGSGRKYIHTMLANGVVSERLMRVLIGPGSVIDAAALRREITACGDHLLGVDIVIHPHAAVVTQRHRDLEQGPMTKIGSTKKGVGEAMIQRIRRDPQDMNTAMGEGGQPHQELVAWGLGGHVASVESYNSNLDRARFIQIEGAQGYSLSMYHGFYPYTTSRDVSLFQTLADCGIPAAMLSDLEVIGTCRAFPIRVGNRYDDAGNQIGWSGPCYRDQREISFEEIDQPIELTTVTKLPRRVFTFSHLQLQEAVRMNRVDHIFLNFVNYLPEHEQSDFFKRVERVAKRAAGGCSLSYIGKGPTKNCVFRRVGSDLL